jgi:dipeptidyl-peptidase-4
MRKALLVFTLLAAPLFAQKKVITLEAIYDPVERVYFSGAIQSGFHWLDDRTFVWPRKDAKGEFVEWRLFDASNGRERPLFEHAKLQAALEGAGIPSDMAKRSAESSGLTFDVNRTAAVLTLDDDLYLYSLARGTITRLTSTAGEEESPTFSPDGQRIAFTRDHDLYVTDLTGRERRLTTDGSADTLNGKLDYVYMEEVYGRGNWKAFWWSPDSARLAYLQLDERGVPEFTIADEIPYHLDLETFEYPKAGDPNPKVKLKVVRATGGSSVDVDTSGYTAAEHLIVNVDWSRNDEIVFQVQNREQTWLDLIASTTAGKTRRILRDSTPAWIDPIAAPHYLTDGSFLWQSERSGHRHLYHYDADGTLKGQITKGEWEVRDLHGVDEKNGWIYFSGTERSVLGTDVYRIRLDGTGLQRISAEEGQHSAAFNPSMTMYVDRWSNITTPDQVRVHRADGAPAHVLEINRVAHLEEYELPRPEFLQVKTRDGFPMEAMMIKPTNFDPSKKYPVYQYTYAGPHAQQVRNAWRGDFMLFNQLLAQQGIIVWMCDNRTASGKGAVSAWPVYKNFGELELRDIEDGLAWLKQQPYVDDDRIIINGWSYGGFMVSYALTHSKSFKAGIAGGSVTDWRNYDSIYTERYMLMPQNNPEGYRKSSPRFSAENLHGELLLIHGSIDDNVHPQNTIQFAHALQDSGKQFGMMLYPKSRHGVRDKKKLAHLQRLVFEFVTKHALE